MALLSVFHEAFTAPTSARDVGQELLHAALLLSCAFVGFAASTWLLKILDYQNYQKARKAKEGSNVFHKEVAAYVKANTLKGATEHFGLSRCEILNCIDAVEQNQWQLKVGQICQLFQACSKRKSSLKDESSSQATETDSEDECEEDLKFSVAPSLNPGLMLLEQYGAFGALSGTWSVPVVASEEEEEEEEYEFSIAPSREPGLMLLEQYDVFGGYSGMWSGPLTVSPTPTQLLPDIGFTIEDGKLEVSDEDELEKVGDISTEEPSVEASTQSEDESSVDHEADSQTF